MGLYRFWGSAIVASAWVIQPTSSAAAQETAEAQSSVIVFDRNYFQPFNPSDALDMVRRVPGFTIIESDPDLRGFAGSTANILFDGKAPASKQETTEELLKRITAANVERVELIRGGAAGIDMGGHAVVVNVVRRTAPISRASATTGLVTADDGKPHPISSAEASWMSGKRRLQASVDLLAEIDEDSGKGDVTTIDAQGSLVGVSRRANWEIARTRAATVEYATPLLNGELSVNGSLRRENVGVDTNTFPTLGEPQFVEERERLTSLEAGARFSRALNPNLQFDALAIQRTGRLRAEEGASEGEDREQFTEATRTSETIGRMSLRREGKQVTVEVSAEGTINRLKSTSSLVENGTQVELPGSDAHVEERRAEVALGTTWTPMDSLVIEQSLRAEFSTIVSQGPFGEHNSFLFWKPRLATTYALGKSDQLRFHIQRDVGQLDFGDFVASASLENGNVSAGALSLTPPQTWIVAAAYEHRFWEDGAIVLSLEHQWISDVIDRDYIVVDGEAFDVVANIGNGTRDVATIELSVPLQRLGLKGMQLTSTIIFTRSRVTDPVTGEKRVISEDKPIEGNVRLTQDLFRGRLNWGLKLELAEREHEYRFDEVRRKHEQLSLGAHVEFRPSAVWRIRLEGSNLNGRMLSENRRKFDGPRSSMPLQEVERRRTRTTPTVTLTVRRSF